LLLSLPGVLDRTVRFVWTLPEWTNLPAGPSGCDAGLRLGLAIEGWSRAA